MDNGADVHVRCEIADEGRFGVSLLANESQFGTFSFIGRIGVNNDL